MAWFRGWELLGEFLGVGQRLVVGGVGVDGVQDFFDLSGVLGVDADFEVVHRVGLDVADGAEHEAADVGEGGGASRGDAVTGEEEVEIAEGAADAAGVAEIERVVGEIHGEVAGTMLLVLVERAVGAVTLEDVGAATALGGGEVAAASEVLGLRCRCVIYGRSFLLSFYVCVTRSDLF